MEKNVKELEDFVSTFNKGNLNAIDRVKEKAEASFYFDSQIINEINFIKEVVGKWDKGFQNRLRLGQGWNMASHDNYRI